MNNGTFPTTRMRRLRQHPVIRQMVREASISVTDLICPIFITHGQNIRQEVSTMPGYYQWSLDRLPEEIDAIVALGIQSVLLFGIPAEKDALGSASYSDQGIIQQAIALIKNRHPDLLVITDVCFCEYTDHGHCGVLNESSGRLDVDNDATLTLLAQQAISHVRAGADMVAPSGMMDGMIAAIRQGLDQHHFSHIPIISYSAKYASALYSAFRAAVNSAPSAGNRKGYQMDPANGEQALREVALDITEGADMVMIKPAMHYLDIIKAVHQQFPGVPIAAYSVGSEYAMYKAASQLGAIDEKACVLEFMISLKRAGASVIITYHAKDIACWLAE